MGTGTNGAAGKRAFKVALSLTAAAALAAGVGWLVQSGDGSAGPSAPSSTKAMAARVAYGPSDYGAAIAQGEQALARQRARLSYAPDEWLRMEGLAIALMDQEQLVGERAFGAEADLLLARALALAPARSGPALAIAEHALSRHDLAGAEAALARHSLAAVPSDAERAANAGFVGDIAFQRGSPERARTAYREAARLAPGFASSSRLANLALWQGDTARAERIAARAIAGTSLTPARAARASLMRADLAYARGDLDAAAGHVADARRVFPGWPLGEAYHAQTLIAEGRMAEAETLLERLVQSERDADTADLLTGLYLERGKTREAAMLAQQTGARWDEHMAAEPDAWRLHAAEHHLDFGDPARALALAEEEARKRPFGPALEVYASALTANDRPSQALAVLDRAERVGWRSVSLSMSRADALAALGKAREAERALAAARKLNPDAEGPLRTLLRFGHY